jgi:hypothetical protein
MRLTRDCIRSHRRVIVRRIRLRRPPLLLFFELACLSCQFFVSSRLMVIGSWHGLSVADLGPQMPCIDQKTAAFTRGEAVSAYTRLYSKTARVRQFSSRPTFACRMPLQVGKHACVFA